MKKIAYWGAFLSLGPITGPLMEGVYRNWRKGEHILAGLYAVAVVTTFIALPTAAVLAWRFVFWIKAHQ